jgi:hypothetical protein
MVALKEFLLSRTSPDMLKSLGIILIVAGFLQNVPKAVLDTLSGQEDDVAATLILGRRHGHRGLAAELWPRTV